MHYSIAKRLSNLRYNLNTIFLNNNILNDLTIICICPFTCVGIALGSPAGSIQFFIIYSVIISECKAMKYMLLCFLFQTMLNLGHQQQMVSMLYNILIF